MTKSSADKLQLTVQVELTENNDATPAVWTHVFNEDSTEKWGFDQKCMARTRLLCRGDSNRTHLIHCYRRNVTVVLLFCCWGICIIVNWADSYQHDALVCVCVCVCVLGLQKPPLLLTLTQYIKDRETKGLKQLMAPSPSVEDSHSFTLSAENKTKLTFTGPGSSARC